MSLSYTLPLTKLSNNRESTYYNFRQKYIMSRQEDEISSLESIFNEEEILRSEEHGPSAGQFCAFVDLPSDFRIVYSLPEGGLVTLPFITYLPPIVLHYSLPSDYPVNPKSPPTFTLTCHWLTREQLSKLCKNLDKLWEDNIVDDMQGTEILYIWAQFLKLESLLFLNIQDTLNISAINRLHSLNIDSRLCGKQGTSKLTITNADVRAASKVGSELAQDLAVQCKSTEGSKPQLNKTMTPGASRVRPPVHDLDCRAVLDLNVSSTLSDFLIDYDEKKSADVFAREVHTCDICYANKKGTYCVRFIPCNHAFCEECTRTYFTVNIQSGKLFNITCPEGKCNSDATFNQIKSLISPELFARYDAMLLEATLNSLGDIVICPRPGCQYTVTRDGDEKLASCFQCRYAFCIECRMGYHGIEPCRMKSSDQQALVKEYMEGSTEERGVLEKRFGKKRLDALVETTLTDSWISDNSKACPHCKVSIQKSFGCNKITCWKCGTNFCWLCSAQLDKTFPYIHFSKSTSPCFQLLFHGVIENEGEDVLDLEEDGELINDLDEYEEDVQAIHDFQAVMEQHMLAAQIQAD